MKTTQRKIENSESKLISDALIEYENQLNTGLNWKWIISLGIIMFLSAIHIYYFDSSNWSLISKLLVVISPICIWVIIESKYKGRGKRISELNDLRKYKSGSPIDVLEIYARRALKFEEKEDEGVLYLIETIDRKNFYLWDDQWLIPEELPFPNTDFEIYINDGLKLLLETKIKCKGEKINPIIISGIEKWKYFQKRGFPGDLESEMKHFDEVLGDLKTLQ